MFKTILFVSFVWLKYQNGCNLRGFLGVKFCSRVLLRVRELTFRNSGYQRELWKTARRNLFIIACKAFLMVWPHFLPHPNSQFQTYQKWHREKFILTRQNTHYTQQTDWQEPKVWLLKIAENKELKAKCLEPFLNKSTPALKYVNNLSLWTWYWNFAANV